MSHKGYRICLLLVVVIAIITGIFYYLNYVQEKTDITGGTLVYREQLLDDDRYESKVCALWERTYE